ncbi:hypothetical protein ATANTOWER_025139 [Ataeniobius toweri]|uniref:BED-type domain-containing protein n=1 Tax=Ataeniobius toweri TaxID=208326 RepID=A0ABU7BIK4_9TELE|nr:hypothetical protein [Ataeniobius toweri]
MKERLNVDRALLHSRDGTKAPLSTYSTGLRLGRLSVVWFVFQYNQVPSQYGGIMKCDANYPRCNICDVKCKASGGNSSNLRKHLVKHKIFLKAEETIFASLRSTATTPAFSTVSTPASVPVSIPR